MNVNEMLILAEMEKMLLVAGKNALNNRFSTVAIIDSHEGAKRLHGGELVISTGFPMSESLDIFKDHIMLLVNNRAAALIIQMGMHIHSIPEEIIKLADNHSLPVICSPLEYGLDSIINPILRKIADNQSKELEHNLEMNNSFLQLAVDNSEVESILKTLSRFLGRKTAYVDKYFNKTYYCDSKAKEIFLISEDGLSLYNSPKIYQFEHYAVSNKSNLFGYLLLEKPHVKNMFINTSKAISQASIVLVLKMQMQISNKLIEEKYSTQLIEDLLLHNIKTHEEVYSRANLNGWNLSEGGRVIIVDVNNIKSHYTKQLNNQHHDRMVINVATILNNSIAEINKIFVGSHYYLHSDFVAIIIPNRVSLKEDFLDKINTAFHNIRESIALLGNLTVSIAIGDYVEDIFDIHKSYNQAKESIAFSYKAKKFDCVIPYSDLRMYSLIQTLSQNSKSHTLIEKYILPLLNYDKANNTELLPTLKAISEHGFNLKSASTALYIHYNSIKYRYQKIEQLIGECTPSARFELELALRMHEIK